MNVLFIFCNGSDDAISFPLGIGLLSAILKKRGHLVKGIYLDYSNPELVNLENICDKARLFDPGVTCYSATSPAFVFIKEVAKYLKRRLNIPTICGGVHPTLYPKDSLSAEGIDYICVGEGERALVEFVENIEDLGKDKLNIPGIWKRGKKGDIIKNNLYPLNQNLDEFPKIDFDVFGKDFIDNETQSGWLRFIISRGCPYSCSYCHNNLIRKTYAEGIGCSEADLGYIRFQSIDSVIEELLEKVKKYNIKVINFMDDLFCLNKERTLEFCRKFKEKLPPDVGYSIQTHLSQLNKELVGALRASRCLRVVVGVESACPRISQIFNRKTNLRVMKENLSMLLKAKFPLGIWTLNMLGNPTETKEEMLQTLSFNASHLVNVCKFNFLAPYLGSEIYKFCVNKNLLSQDYDAQRFEDRYSTVLKHKPIEGAFLEKFFDIGHWYMNVLAPLELESYYEPLIDEIEKIPVGQWHTFKEKYKKEDRLISQQLCKNGKVHYDFLFQGKITGKVIGLTRGENVFKYGDPAEERNNERLS